MKNSILKIATILAVGLSILSCSKDGEPGKDGLNGTNGIAGTSGTNGTNGIDASIQNTGFVVGPNQDRPAQVITNLGTKVTLDRELIDNLNAFNPATSELIIPTTGFYHLNANMLYNGNFATNTNASLSFFVNGGQLRQVVYSLIGPNPSISLTANSRLFAGDVITIFASQNTAVAQTISTNVGVSNFSGYRVY